MGFVLGLAESSYVTIGLFVFPLIIGLFLRYKQRAENADTMKEVDKIIADELKPIIKTMEEYERDIKELRKDELEPIKTSINNIMREQDVMNNILNTLVSTLDKNHTEIKDILKDRDRSYKENFLLLFDKLDGKQDKK